MSDIIVVPIVIVGGGACGLSLSIFLSKLKIEHVLFERHPGTSIQPKAHIISQRTMEVFRQYEIADEIVRQGTPPHQMSQVVWQTSLGGEGPLDRKVLGTLDAWGCKAGTEQHATYQRDAPFLPTNLPLLRLEPILHDIAEKNNAGKIMFNHKVIDFRDEGESVIVEVENRGDKQITTYRAQYMFGADGGKTVGPKLGIEMEGPKELRKMVSAHFEADMSKYWDDRTCISHFSNPESGSGRRSGSMLPLGPTWGRHSEQWQMHFSTEVGAPALTVEDAKPRIRALLKLPDLELKIMGVANWVLERVLADSYRKGRIFLGGDATHRHPPTTGLGLNTAVQDAHNIAWKLSLVLKEKASPSILDTYESERRQIGKQITDWAYFTWKNHGVIAAAIGLREGEPEFNHLHFLGLLDDTEIGKASRATLQNVINSQVIEHGAHEMDLGLHYKQGCLVHDGTVAPPMDPIHQKYKPTTRPGHRFPHIWVERQGKVFSTQDLVGQKGDFLLVTGRGGGAWIESAKLAARSKGVGLQVAQITGPFNGVKEGEYVDPEGLWELVKGINGDGAIVVRPDNVVGWRSSGPGNPEEISEAFDKILGFGQASTNGHW